MRELFVMADGRRRDEWRRTAQICSTLANCHRDPSTSPFSDDDFNPFAEQHKTKHKPIKAPITILKSIFVRQEA